MNLLLENHMLSAPVEELAMCASLLSFFLKLHPTEFQENIGQNIGYSKYLQLMPSPTYKLCNVSKVDTE